MRFGRIRIWLIRALVGATVVPAAWSGAAEEAVTPENVLDRSLQVLQAAANDFPNSPLPHYVKGGVYFRSQRYERAIEAYQKALKIRPKSAEIQYHLAFAHSRSHRYEEAVSWYRKVIDIRPDYPKANQRLGKALLEMDRATEAIDALKREVEYYPESPAAHYYLGEAYWQEGRFEKAIKHARATVKLDDRYPEPHYLMAKAYRSLGNRKDAKEALVEFREKKESETKRLDSVAHITDSESASRAVATAHFEVGQAYQAHRSMQKAILHYERAVELNPEHVDARLRLVELYQKEGKSSRAIELARELVARVGEHPQYRMVLGMTLASDGKWDEAAEQLGRANELAPTDSKIARRYARVLLQGRQSPREALSVMRRVTQDGGEAEDFDLLSRIYYGLGDLKKSLAAMQKAMQQAPERSVYQKRYRQLKQKLGP